MVEVFVKIVAEALSILSIATKEVKRKRASELYSARNTSILDRSQVYISGNCWEGRTLRTR
jgi:hypothetical protein